jgi:hypothetical protein
MEHWREMDYVKENLDMKELSVDMTRERKLLRTRMRENLPIKFWHYDILCLSSACSRREINIDRNIPEKTRINIKTKPITRLNNTTSLLFFR